MSRRCARKTPECVRVPGVTRHLPPSAPADTDSELSLSGFLSVASHSYEEDEGRDTPLFRSLRRRRRRRPTGEPRAMSGDGDHGNQAAQCNGVKKYRWVGVSLFRFLFFWGGVVARR